MKFKPAFFYLLLSSVIWGATVPIMKITLTQIPLFTLAFLRMLFAAIILGYLFHSKLAIKKEDFKIFVIAGLTGTTFNLLFFFEGLKLTKAINASLLTATVPIFTILAAHLFLREKIGVKITIAALLALFGCIIIIGKPDTSFKLAEVIGSISLLISTLFWVANEIISKNILKKYPPETLAFYLTAIGAFTFMPFFAFEVLKNPFWTVGITKGGFFGLIYGIVFSSTIAYWAWQKGLSKLPTQEASFFFYLDPISGAVLSIILLHEKITSTLIIGAVLIFIAVILSESRRRSHPLHKS